MKKALIAVVKITVLVVFAIFGVFAVHFLFVMGVDMAKENELVNQCKTYADSKNVTYVGVVNAFTYEGNTNHAVCRISDLYEKLVFINDQNEKLNERNARSLRYVDSYDPSDSSQAYTLSLYQGEPVYVHKMIERDRIRIAYYSFDRLSLLFQIDSEE